MRNHRLLRLLLASSPQTSWVLTFCSTDTSGSYADDLPIFQAQAPTIIGNIQAENPDTRFAVVTFEDYPISPYGAASDLPYRKDLDFTSDASTATTVIAGLSTRSGADFPESQLTAIYESIAGSDPVSFRAEAIKIIILWTDASFHRSEDEPGYPGPTTYDVLDALDDLASSRRRSRRQLEDGIEEKEGCFPFCTEPLPPPPSWPVRFIGVDRGNSPDVIASLAEFAEFTGTFAGPTGVDCNGDGEIDLMEGDPIVCPGVSGESLGSTIEAVITEAIDTLAPVAQCIDIDTATDVGVCYATDVWVDNGSYDPNGGEVQFNVEQSPDPMSQFGIGSTPVDLVAVNQYRLTDTCTATVTVRDIEDPILDCNVPADGIAPNISPVWIKPQATDNCGIDSISVRDIMCFKVNKKGKKIPIPCKYTLGGGNDGAFRIDNTRGVGTHWRWTIETKDINSNSQSKHCELIVQNPGNGNKLL